jgi:hypothetical protein
VVPPLALRSERLALTILLVFAPCSELVVFTSAIIFFPPYLYDTLFFVFLNFLKKFSIVLSKKRPQLMGLKL